MLGYQAGDALTTGYENVAVGKGALGVANDGHSNTAVGYLAMGATATHAGSSNVAIGWKTMQDVNDGFANTYVGTAAGGSEGGVSGAGSTGSEWNTAVNYAVPMVEGLNLYFGYANESSTTTKTDLTEFNTQIGVNFFF